MRRTTVASGNPAAEMEVEPVEIGLVCPEQRVPPIVSPEKFLKTLRAPPSGGTEKERGERREQSNTHRQGKRSEDNV